MTHLRWIAPTLAIGLFACGDENRTAEPADTGATTDTGTDADASADTGALPDAGPTEPMPDRDMLILHAVLARPQGEPRGPERTYLADPSAPATPAIDFGLPATVRLPDHSKLIIANSVTGQIAGCQVSPMGAGLCISDLSGGNLQQLTFVPRGGVTCMDREVAVSPDSKWAIFVRGCDAKHTYPMKRTIEGETTTVNVVTAEKEGYTFLINLETKEIEPLVDPALSTPTAHLLWGTWSNDSKTVYLSQSEDAGYTHRLIAIDIASKNARVVRDLSNVDYSESDTGYRASFFQRPQMTSRENLLGLLEMHRKRTGEEESIRYSLVEMSTEDGSWIKHRDIPNENPFRDYLFALSPDESRVAYATCRDDGDYNPCKLVKLATSDLNGENEVLFDTDFRSIKGVDWAR